MFGRPPTLWLGGRPRLRVTAAVVGSVLIVSGSLTPSLASTDGPTGTTRIIRDNFGVPHIFGQNAEDVSYGAGYSQAQDRLWQMHVFRRIGEGRFTELFGPTYAPVDKLTNFFTYSEAERLRKFETSPVKIQSMMRAYVDGINAYIDEVRADPAGKLPAEFTTYGVGVPEPWTLGNSIAIGDLLTFAVGAQAGGFELEQAGVLQTLIAERGEKVGRQLFDDLVPTVDPDALPTVPSDFDFRRTTTAADEKIVDSVKAFTADARLSLSAGERAPVVGTDTGSGADLAASTGTQRQLALVPDVRRALEQSEWFRQGRKMLFAMFKSGSNMQVAGPRFSASGNSLATSGPQNGWLIPSWHADLGLHSADGLLDAVGITIVGAGPIVLMGIGRGYSFGSTTGFTDNIDTYAVQLGAAPRTYLYNGKTEKMDCRTETYDFRGVPVDSQEICRTRQGPVLAFDEPNRTAYVLRIPWYDRETQTALGAFGWNRARSLKEFATYTQMIPVSLNMGYADDQGNYAYWNSANHAVRPAGTDIRLPQDGSGLAEWRGMLSLRDMPHAVNPPRGWMFNWNSLPAAGWPAERAFTPLGRQIDLDRVMDLAKAPVVDPSGGKINTDRRFDYDDMAAQLRYVAFKHHPDTAYRPLLPFGAPGLSETAKKALDVVSEWDGFNTDNDGDGRYHAGKSIIDAWIQAARKAVFTDDFAGGSQNPNWYLTADGNIQGGLLWHVLKQDDKFQLSYDFLNGEAPLAVRVRALEAAVADLTRTYASSDPSTWKQPVVNENYTRLTPALASGVATGGAGVTADSGVPGDAPSHLRMDRGTSNHIVAYLAPPAPGTTLGTARVRAGNVLGPGQSGFVSQTGQEDRHFQDQAPLYANWKFKPMIMTLAEAEAAKESELTLTRVLTGPIPPDDYSLQALRSGRAKAPRTASVNADGVDGTSGRLAASGAPLSAAALVVATVAIVGPLGRRRHRRSTL